LKHVAKFKVVFCSARETAVILDLFFACVVCCNVRSAGEKVVALGKIQHGSPTFRVGNLFRARPQFGGSVAQVCSILCEECDTHRRITRQEAKMFQPRVPLPANPMPPAATSRLLRK
jgi:hypothetical protein